MPPLPYGARPPTSVIYPRGFRRGSDVDESELAQAAIFSLEQSARRIRALADQARTPQLVEQLRGLADLIDGHARELAALRAASS